MIKIVQIFCLASVVSALLAGCYRRPCEDDYCVIPTTNNPAIIRDDGAWKPGLSY